MSKKEQVEQLTNYMANFVDHIGKVLPDDIIEKLDELAEKEDSPLSKTIYKTMKENQKLAKELNRPSCQDTGVLLHSRHHFVTTVLRHSTNTTQERTLVKEHLQYSGISYQIVMNVKSMHTWQVEDVLFQEKLWY